MCEFPFFVVDRIDPAALRPTIERSLHSFLGVSAAKAV
jgi:hypothetical protein